MALGPTINMVRDPRWGRAYETFGEDPYLTGELATADVQGLQSQGVMAVIKHAAAYNIEQPAGTIIVSPRVLQEIYLPAFQTAIEKGGAAGVMCAYSSVNNLYSCQNPAILNTPLYQQAGFTGFVTSDWGAIHSTVDSANAGETIEMPFGGFFGPNLLTAVANGQVTQATFDTMVSRMLTQMFRFGMFDKAPTGSTTAVVTTYAHAQVALRGAEEGTVLLKNNGILPLNAERRPVRRGHRGRRRRRRADHRRRQRHGDQPRHLHAALRHHSSGWPAPATRSATTTAPTRPPPWPWPSPPASRSSSPATTTGTRRPTTPPSTCRTTRTR